MVKTQVAYKPHPKNMRLDLETIVKKLYQVFFAYATAYATPTTSSVPSTTSRKLHT